MTRQERPTLADVAAAAGVSVSTASLAFSGAGPVASATRDRVLAAAAQLGYSGPNPLARSLRRGRSGVIGIVLGSGLRRAFNDPVLTQTLDGVAQELGERGFGLLLVPSEHYVDVPPLVQQGAMDGAIITGLADWSDPLLVALKGRGVAVVRIDAGPGDEAGVGIADRAGMADIGRHVLSLGHRRIGILALPLGHRHETTLVDPVDPGPIPFTPTANRWAGLRDAGVVATAAAEAALSTVEEGMVAARLLLALPERPTAVVAFSDLLAAGAVIAARELGLRVPQDVSITGFDGIDLPWLAPDRLTTAAQPLMEKGRLTARAVAALVEGEATKYESLPVTVEIGTTTGLAPA